MTRFKRGLLALCSAVWWLGMMGLLLKTGAAPAAKQEGLLFPFMAPGTTLRIDGLALYEGETAVAGEKRFVTDAMALLITNLGQKLVQEAEVVIWIGNVPYTFAVSYLPPARTVLAVEVSGAAFVGGRVQRCAASAGYTEALPLRIEEDAQGSVFITNTGTAATGSLLLHYRAVDSQTGIYIGGLAYSLPIGPLLPGESRAVQPPNYAYGYSRVVGVTEK